MDLYDKKQFRRYLEKMIYADCWAVYLTKEDRTPIKIYHDNINNTIVSERTDEMIESLIPDMLSNKNSLLHITMNHHFFTIVARTIPETDQFCVAESRFLKIRES
jgi:hypothetical protein